MPSLTRRPACLVALLCGLLALPGVADAAGAGRAKASASKKPATASSGPSRAAPTRRGQGRTALAAARSRRRAPASPVELFHVNRRDKMFLRLADAKGRPIRRVDQQAKRFFRCHHTNKQHRIDSRLLRLIYSVGRHYDGKRVEVIAGYRHPKAASRNPKTLHKEGKACDFRIVGVKNTELRDYLRKNFKAVGVGYYPNSNFVHLDIRDKRSAFWIDYSGPGEKPNYSENAEADLRSGQADNSRTRIDPSWVNSPAGGAAARPAERGEDGESEETGAPEGGEEPDEAASGDLAAR